MEALDLLRRARAKDDERQVIVSLTARGLASKRRAAAYPVASFAPPSARRMNWLPIRDHLLVLRARLLKKTPSSGSALVHKFLLLYIVHDLTVHDQTGRGAPLKPASRRHPFNHLLESHHVN